MLGSLDLNSSDGDLASNSNTESRPPIRNREFELLCQNWRMMKILQYPKERWCYPQRKRRQVLGRTGCPWPFRDKMSFIVPMATVRIIKKNMLSFQLAQYLWASPCNCPAFFLWKHSKNFMQLTPTEFLITITANSTTKSRTTNSCNVLYFSLPYDLSYGLSFTSLVCTASAIFVWATKHTTCNKIQRSHKNLKWWDISTTELKQVLDLWIIQSI